MPIHSHEEHASCTNDGTSNQPQSEMVGAQRNHCTCNFARKASSKSAKLVGFPPVSPSTARSSVVRWQLPLRNVKRVPSCSYLITNHAMSQFDTCSTSAIFPSEFQKGSSTTTAIFLPHLDIVGTLICSWGIKRFGPEERKSGLRLPAGKGIPGPCHDFMILKSFPMLSPEKYTACISTAHHLSVVVSG